MPSRKRLAVVAALVVVAGVVLFVWSRRLDHESSNGLRLYGNVDVREVSLAFIDSERIESMTAVEGAAVAKGEVLARLHTARLQAAVDQAQAQVDAQAQVVARLQAGARDEEIRKARADLAAAQVRRDNAKVQLERIGNLAARNVASQSQLDDARAAADAGIAQAGAAQAALDLLLAGTRKEDVAQARAVLAALHAALSLAQQNLADAQLRAPAAGIIRNRILEPGDMASPQTPVYTLALSDPLWVRAYVDEPDLGRLREGMRATVHTDSFPDRSYDGWVGYISPTAEFTPKSVETEALRSDLVYQARIYVCNPEGELRQGMPATVTIAADAPVVAEPGCTGG